MRKIFLALGAGLMLSAMSCGSQNNASPVTTSREQFYKLGGQWELASVSQDKGFKIKPFDEGVDLKCWEKSQWKLVANNNTGNYTMMPSEGCPSKTQAIKFDVSPQSEFKFKKIMPGEAAKNVTAGYSVMLQNQTDNAFTLEQSVPFEGNYLKVYYNFVKISK